MLRDATITHLHCDHANRVDVDFCMSCSKLLRSTNHLRGLWLAFAVLTVPSGLLWAAALYVGLNH